MRPNKNARGAHRESNVFLKSVRIPKILAFMLECVDYSLYLMLITWELGNMLGIDN